MERLPTEKGITRQAQDFKAISSSARRIRMPNTVYISQDRRPIEKVWGIMRDFNGMPSYHPGITKSVIEGDCPSDQVGMHTPVDAGRRIRFGTSALPRRRDYVFTYEIIEGTLPVRDYVAGVRLHRVDRSQPNLLRNGGPISKSWASTATQWCPGLAQCIRGGSGP